MAEGCAPVQASPLKTEEEAHVPVAGRERTEPWRPESTARAQEVGLRPLFGEDGFGVMAVRVWEAPEMGQRWAEQQAPLTLEAEVTYMPAVNGFIGQ